MGIAVAFSRVYDGAGGRMAHQEEPKPGYLDRLLDRFREAVDEFMDSLVPQPQPVPVPVRPSREPRR
jgi:hypothetical protein